MRIFLIFVFCSEGIYLEIILPETYKIRAIDMNILSEMENERKKAIRMNIINMEILLKRLRFEIDFSMRLLL
jgi:hypothetical protein